MVKRQMNSFGTITIPKDIREELGISGTAIVRLEVRESNNMKELVIRKSDDISEVLNRYSHMAEIISRISECTVAVVWNNMLVSMSVAHTTETFVGKSHYVDADLQKKLKGFPEGDSKVVVKSKNILYFLPNNIGEVRAYYKIPNTGDDRGFFVLLKGTKQDSSVSISPEECCRRYEIISDVINIGLG